jgi:FkbH-like protein
MSGLLASDQLRTLRRAWRSATRAPGYADSHDSSIGLAGSFTIDPLVPYLGAFLVAAGEVAPKISLANYNQVLRVCFDRAAEFGDAKLDILILLWRLEDLGDPVDCKGIRDASEMLLRAIEHLRADFTGTILIGIPPRPRPVTDCLTDFSRPSELLELWYAQLTALSKLIRSHSGIYAFELEALVARLGESVALDYRTELLYRQPYGEHFYVACGEALCRLIKARKAEPKKCLVVDCDNTLWGGVIGEDGVGGVMLSDDFPGAAFRQFQKQLAMLRRSGVFIALNTKNNPDDVWEMFDDHSGMVLKRSDISAAKINWRPKSDNLREIAKDLNIGLDALVFIDDNKFEVEEVSTYAPEVTTFLVPEDLADLPVMMRKVAGFFDRLDITGDDRARTDMMHQEASRREFAQELAGEEFLSSLNLEVFIYPPTETDLARVAQLINKTNQFNTTTRRYTLEDVKAFVASESHDVLCATVRDRFGDYGLVGVVILSHAASSTEFDTLLMSCRVLGRGIETALISNGIRNAAERGLRAVRGFYIPTRKNGMVADLFERHGFSVTSEGTGDAEPSEWTRNVEGLDVPSFLAVRFDRPADPRSF